MPDVAGELALFQELRRFAVEYRGRHFLPGLDEIIARLTEPNPNMKEIRSLYRTLLQSKGQLGDFHVEPSQSKDWLSLSQRISHITAVLASELGV